MLKHVTVVLLLAALLTLLQTHNLAAQEAREPGADVEERNFVELFLGGVSKDIEGETDTGVGLGVSYVRRVSRLVGLGVLLELATGEARDAVLLLPVILRVYEGLNFLGAPGVEITPGGEAAFALRLGIVYEFELPAVSLSPEFSVDLVEGDVTFVYGVAVGFGF